MFCYRGYTGSLSFLGTFILDLKASSILHPDAGMSPSKEVDLMTRFFQTSETHSGTVHCQCCGIGSLTFSRRSGLSSFIAMKYRLSYDTEGLGAEIPIETVHCQCCGIGSLSFSRGHLQSR